MRHLIFGEIGGHSGRSSPFYHVRINLVLYVMIVLLRSPLQSEEGEWEILSVYPSVRPFIHVVSMITQKIIEVPISDLVLHLVIRKFPFES